jgi:cytoskeleton protein RodZ
VNRPEAEIAELPTDPGARLRRQREHAGLDVQQVAERLNLDVVAVQALESDDYSVLGAPVFVRGHIRRYASLLGLPAEEILGAYDRSRAQLAPPTLVPKSHLEMVLPRRRVVPQWVVAGALVLIVVAGVAAYVGEFGLQLPDTGAAGVAGIATESSAPVGASAAGGDAGAAAGSNGGSKQVASAGQAVTASAANAVAPGVEPTAAVPPGQVALTFVFAADSWIEVYDGSGKSVLYDLGKAGTERTVAGAGPLSVTLGNAPGVSLLVNGRRVTVPVPPPGETVARFGVVADGLQR